MNILQYIAIDRAKQLFNLLSDATNPDYYLMLCNDIVYGDGNEDSLLGCEPYRYWMICQKLLCSALLLVHRACFPADRLPSSFLQESFLLPSPQNYMSLMAASSDFALGIGTPGTWELQLALYELLGWKVSYVTFDVVEWNETEYYQVFLQFRHLISRKHWRKTMKAVDNSIYEYASQSFTLVFLEYPDLTYEDIYGVFSELFPCAWFVHLQEEKKLMYLIPSEFYGIADVDERQDLSSMNPYGVFCALRNHLGASLMLPDGYNN